MFGFKIFDVIELTTTTLKLELFGKTQSLEQGSDYELKTHFEYEFEKIE